MGEAQRRRRQFIRAHHPDRGGDPDAFIAGLRSLDSESGSSGREPLPRVVIVRRRAWRVRLAAAAMKRLGLARQAPRVR